MHEPRSVTDHITHRAHPRACVSYCVIVPSIISISHCVPADHPSPAPWIRLNTVARHHHTQPAQSFPATTSSSFSTMPRAPPTPRTPVTPRTTSNTVGGERNRRVSRKNVPSRRPSAAARANQRPPPLTPMRQKTRQRLLTAGGTPRPRRFRPGTRAIMEIRKFQRSTGLLIRRLPFARLVKEISQSYHHSMRYVIFLRQKPTSDNCPFFKVI